MNLKKLQIMKILKKKRMKIVMKKEEEMNQINIYNNNDF